MKGLVSKTTDKFTILVGYNEILTKKNANN
jgi:hypothetical protein